MIINTTPPLYFSTKGPRVKNEDSFVIQSTKNGHLLIIADGLGGHNAGDIASNYAVTRFSEEIQKQPNITKDFLVHITTEINKELIHLSKKHSTLSGMSTTFTAVYIFPNNSLIGVHTGDTRLYVLRNKGLLQLTLDQTEAQALFSDGLISKEELANYPRKNQLTNALGNEYNDLKLESLSYNLEPLDRVILSTDGFYSIVHKKLIVETSLSNNNFSSFFFELIKLIDPLALTDNCTLLGLEVPLHYSPIDEILCLDNE